MESRVSVISIILKNEEAAIAVNELLLDLNQTSQEELLKVISLHLTLHSIVYSAIPRASWFLMLQKVKYWMYLQDHSVVSVFSQSKKWEDSTVTY